MKEQLSVSKVNESFIKVSCSASVAMELSEYFSFEQENAKFSPKYRARIWDGRIRLFNLVTNTMYAGLYLRLLKFCKDRDYDLIKVPTEYGLPLDIHPIKPLTLDQFIDVLRLPENRIPHDYQVAAIYNSLRHKGKLNVSPTGSGKSLIIYIIARYLTGYNKLYGRDPNKSLLIVVPTTGLVEQLHSDFKEYSVNNGWDV